MTNENQNQQPIHTASTEVEALVQKLEDGVSQVFTSERYKEYLSTMSKFHNYSANNTLLIMMQNPEATHVAGYHAWESNFDRHVRPMEKAIKILAPVLHPKTIQQEKTDPNTGALVLDKDGQPVLETVTINVPTFRPAYVFDISQTYGKPLPKLISDLTNAVPRYDEWLEVLYEVSPVPIEFRPLDKENGYYSLSNKYIAIKESLSEEHAIKTIVHEISHAILHDNLQSNVPDARTREVQAESVAYVVCQNFGIDTSDYSFGYVAAWSSGKDTKELKASLSTIQKASNQLISSMEPKLRERNLIHEQERKEKFKWKNRDHKEHSYSR